VTGNTVVDALELVSAMPFDPSGTVLAEIPFQGRRVIVVTLHRRESSREAIAEICGGLIEIAGRYDDVQIVCPAHPNPKVRQPVRDLLDGIPNVALIPPLGYQAMIWLLQRCHFVITDSGGLQEEGAAIGRPVLVARRKTERPEGVDAGTAQLVGTDRHAIGTWATRLLSDRGLYERMARATDSYGDGEAARQIVDILYEHSDDT